MPFPFVLQSRSAALAAAGVAVILVWGFGLRAAAPVPLYLGVLEPRAPAVARVAFQYRNAHWAAMPQNNELLEPTGKGCGSSDPADCRYPKMGRPYPQTVAWTVAFDGRTLGTVTSSQPPFYSERKQLGLQILSRDSKPPQMRAGAPEFGFENFRPLVLVSQPNVRDPDGWKPFHPEDSALLQQARKAYRGLTKRSQQCNAQCTDDLLEVQPKGYRSVSGAVLIAVASALKKAEDGAQQLACTCPDAEWDHQPDWFLFAHGSFHHIAAGLTLMDAGDYDGCGVSEILFWSEGEGDAPDSYVLFCPRDGSVQVFKIPLNETF